MNSMAKRSIFKKLITAALVVCAGGVVGLEVNGVEKAFAGNHEHDYTVQYKVNEGETICEHGGEIVKVCLNEGCDAPIVSQPTGPIGHKLKGEWELTAPTLNEKGALVNICLNCDNLLTVELPKLNTTDYAYTETLEEISCQSRTGTGTYTIYFTSDDKGNTSLSNVASEGSTEYSFNVGLGAVAHTLPDGRACEDIAYNLSDPAVAEMIKELHPYIATCEQPGEGYFECAACGESVLVATTREHVYDLNADTTVPKSEPTCEEAGSAEVYCEGCKKNVLVSVPAIGHDYEYELRKEGEELRLYAACRREGCGEFFDTAVECEWESTPATCTEKGKIVYSYLPEGETEPVTYTEEIACIPHTINGVLHTAGKAYNVSDPEEGNGIIEFYGETATCTENGRGYYVCDVCDRPVLVATMREHVYDLNADTTHLQSEPTCEGAGSAEVYCEGCKNTIIVTLPALGHTYEYEVGTDEDNNKYIVGICTVCGAETEKEYFNNYKIESMTIPTCCKEGELIYVYTMADGTEYKETVVLEKTGHILGGKQLPANKTLFNMATEGKGVVETVKSTCQENGRGYYICEFCQETILVETETSHSLVYDTSMADEGYLLVRCTNTSCSYSGQYLITSIEETVKATCTQEGKKIYRYENADGIFCGEFVEVIPKSDDHALQTFSDALHHWVGCENDGCGYVQPGSLEEHTYRPATCTEPQTCTVCGQRLGEELGHSWANACDDTCDREGCTETREPGAHVDLTLDGKCDICGANVELPATPEMPNAPTKPDIDYPQNDSSKWFNDFSGCGSTVSGVSMGVLLLAGAGVLLLKKGKKDE